ncbi:MAG TPA: type III pantothenate kinase [Chloroflexota bacterium]|nr:type III pantothenate kinase [Chloroflexota bacterium]
MLLAIDVGNTNVAAGVFDTHGVLRAHWRWASDAGRTADEYGALLAWGLGEAGLPRAALDGVVLGSVVPALTTTFTALAHTYLHRPPLVVNGLVRTGIPLAVDTPAEVGADRLANALAVARLYGTPAVVVDFGTTTNFDVVDADGAFLGGAFAPGVQTAAESLASRAARLRSVELRAPGTAIGRNTADCMRAGLLYGYVGLVEGLVARIAGELGARPLVVATGGLAPLIVAETRVFDLYDPHLTLRGLRLLYLLNTRPAADEPPPAQVAAAPEAQGRRRGG